MLLSLEGVIEVDFDAAAAKRNAEDEQECMADNPDIEHCTGFALAG